MRYHLKTPDRDGTTHVIFERQFLAKAVAEFNRYNVRKLVIEDAAVDDLRVGGIFRATQWMRS